jgi:hypothetical protein
MNKKQREHAHRRIAELEQNARECNEAIRLSDWVMTHCEDPNVSINRILAYLHRIKTLSDKHNIELGQELLEVIADVDRIVKIVDDFEVSYRRQIKLATRAKNPPPIQASKKCIRCDKREQHFDQYCKRCANDLGLRPQGKV